MKPTVPEVRPLVWTLYKRSAVGCCWHAVLSDGNREDSFVLARARDVLAGSSGCRHEECRRLALLLPRMSRTQRRKLAGQKVEPWRPPSDAHRIGGGYRSPCRACGYVRKRLPSWATPGAVFALRGGVHRIVGRGSTNRGTPLNMHFRDFVRAVAVSVVEPAPPDTPCSKAVFGEFLKEYLATPQFEAEELEHALHVVCKESKESKESEERGGIVS